MENVMREDIVLIGFIPEDCESDFISCGDAESSGTIECSFKVCELEDGSMVIDCGSPDNCYTLDDDDDFFDEDSKLWVEIYERVISTYSKIAEHVSPQLLAYAWAYYQDECSDVYGDDILDKFILVARKKDGSEFSLEPDYLGKIYFNCFAFTEGEETDDEIVFICLNPDSDSDEESFSNDEEDDDFDDSEEYNDDTEDDDDSFARSNFDNDYEWLSYFIENNNESYLRWIFHNKKATPVTTDESGKTAFHTCAESGSVEGLKIFLEYGEEYGLHVDVKTDDDYTPLEYALEFGNSDNALYLLQKGADCSKINRDGDTALHIALHNCAPDKLHEIIKLCIKNGADINKEDDYEYTALDRIVYKIQHDNWAFSQHDALEIVQTFLQNGAKLDNADEVLELIKEQYANSINTLVFTAVESYPLQTLKALVEKGVVDINAADDEQQNLLHYSVESLEKTKFLLELGVDMNAKNSDGLTPFHKAIENGNIDVMEFLYNNGAKNYINVHNDRPNSESTAIQDALRLGNIEKVKQLEKFGADFTYVDDSGNTSIHLALKADFNVVELVTLCVEKGISVDAKNNNEQTALHLASSRYDPFLVEFLLKAGASVDITDEDGQTPLHIATRENQVDVMGVLLKFKANPVAKNHDNETPLDIAKEYNHKKALKLLNEQSFVSESNTQTADKQSHTIRSDYWKILLISFRESECRLFDKISISKEHWLSAGSGVSACPFQLIFGQKIIRICLNIDKANSEENKFIFDSLHKNKEHIENSFGDKLEWLRLDDKKSSRIEYEAEVDGYNKEEWLHHFNWHINNMTKFEKAIKPYLYKAGKELKAK